jgi:hypothetical protein
MKCHAPGPSHYTACLRTALPPVSAHRHERMLRLVGPRAVPSSIMSRHHKWRGSCPQRRGCTARSSGWVRASGCFGMRLRWRRSWCSGHGCQSRLRRGRGCCRRRGIEHELWRFPAARVVIVRQRLQQCGQLGRRGQPGPSKPLQMRGARERQVLDQRRIGRDEEDQGQALPDRPGLRVRVPRRRVTLAVVAGSAARHQKRRIVAGGPAVQVMHLVGVRFTHLGDLKLATPTITLQHGTPNLPPLPRRTTSPSLTHSTLQSHSVTTTTTMRGREGHPGGVASGPCGNGGDATPLPAGGGWAASGGWSSWSSPAVVGAAMAWTCHRGSAWLAV